MMRRKIYDDYYMNYDYDLNNSSEINDVRTDAFILPNPENPEKYSVDVLSNVELPDDSLADADLRDHDFMDNLMYVYYGSHGNNNQVSNYGKEIIIIGSVLSCAAQLLTVLFVAFRKNSRGVNGLFLHLMGCLTASNLLFMLGVYATKSRIKCQIVAIFLHYLHLLTAFWIFLYCYNIYKSAACTKIPRMRYILFAAYGLPFILTLLFYSFAPSSYETKKFCFVSVQRGMILNYMLPIATLIILTTFYSLNGIRKINFELSKLELTSSAESLNAIRSEIAKKPQDCILNGEISGLRECKGCLKALCVLQTGYGVVWFVAVLALENVNNGSSMAVVYAAVSFVLNWSICFKSRVFLPVITNFCGMQDDRSVDDEESKTVNTSTASRDSSDSIPLLIGNENCTEMRELRLEHISTISG